MASAAVHSAVVYSLFVVAPIVCGFSVRSLFCFVVPCVVSCFTIISLGIRELVALLLLCSYGISWPYSLTFLDLLPNLIFVTFPETYHKYRPLFPYHGLICLSTNGIGIKDKLFEQTFLFHCLFWILMAHTRYIGSCKL